MFHCRDYYQVLEMFGCSPICSTPRHPEGNSLVEGLNQTFKKTLVHICKSQPKQGHRLIPLVLWSIRESRNQTLGTSPFMMTMARNPRNLLSLIKETWSGKNPLLHTAGKPSQKQQPCLMTLLLFFSERPGLCKVGQHEIHVTPDFKPKRLKAYRVPEVLKPEVARQIQELLASSNPLTVRGQAPLCVLKGRNGENGVRMCCGYRYLNKFTKGDAYPTPYVSNIIHRVGNGKLDILLGYEVRILPAVNEAKASLADSFCH